MRQIAATLVFAAFLAGCADAPVANPTANRAAMAYREQAQLDRIARIQRPGLRMRALTGVLMEAAAGDNILIAQRMLVQFPGLAASGYWPAIKQRATEVALKNGHPDFVAALDAAPAPAALSAMSQAAAPAVAPAAASDVDTPGEHGSERPGDFAIVVGIEKYENLPEAKYAERDAEAVRKHLRALGIPERNIVVLKGEQATRGKLQGYLEEWLPKNVTFDSSLVVYFSGHGAPDPKTGDAYLVPWDGDPKFLQSTALPLKEVYAALAKVRAKQTIVALDSCFSGAGGRSVLAPGARPLVTQTAANNIPDGLTVLAAASGDEITGTMDEQGHGLFTYYFLKGLNDGRRSTLDLYEYVKPHVQDEAHRQNREQTPTLTGGDSQL